MTILPYRENVTANNEITNDTVTFTDALQKNFVVLEPGAYKLGIEYQWRHEDKDVLHKTRVRVDATENTDLRTLQYMGGAQATIGSTIRMISSIYTLMDLTPATYDIDFQFATDEADKESVLFYRRLFLERYD